MDILYTIYPMSRNPPWIFYRPPHHPPLIAPNTAATVVMSEELMLLVAKILIFFFLVRPTWRQTALVFRSIIKGLQKVTNWMTTRNWLFELINQSYHEEFQFESIWNCDSKWLFPSISYYFHIPKIFLNFFPHTGKNRNRQKSNLLS